jgi:hypothetical protein
MLYDIELYSSTFCLTLIDSCQGQRDVVHQGKCDMRATLEENRLCEKRLKSKLQLSELNSTISG